MSLRPPFSLIRSKSKFSGIVSSREGGAADKKSTHTDEQIAFALKKAEAGEEARDEAGARSASSEQRLAYAGGHGRGSAALCLREPIQSRCGR